MAKKEHKIKGWVEVKDDEIVVGNLGVKVYRRRLDILQEGFSNKEIARVEIKKI